MPVVELPEMVLMEAGVPQRYFTFSLASLKRHKPYLNQYKQCCQYTRNLGTAIERGIGLCLFGPADDFRRHAFFGVVKAALAQNKSVQVVDPEDIVQAHSQGDKLYSACQSADILAISEMELPETVVNKYCQSILFKVLKKRCDQGRPIVVSTSLEVVHPDHSLDMLYPGVGPILQSETVLVNFDETNTCEWLRKGHQMKMSSLVRLKVDRDAVQKKPMSTGKKRNIRIKRRK